MSTVPGAQPCLCTLGRETRTHRCLHTDSQVGEGHTCMDMSTQVSEHRGSAHTQTQASQGHWEDNEDRSSLPINPTFSGQTLEGVGLRTGVSQEPTAAQSHSVHLEGCGNSKVLDEGPQGPQRPQESWQRWGPRKARERGKL